MSTKPNLYNPIHLLSFGFGIGTAKFAPGTMGSLLACALYLPLSQLSPNSYLIFIICAFLIGVYVCGKTAQDLGVHDHSGIVWDEFVGMWITLIAAPAGWLWLIFGFVLFRAFDIVKPWPICWLDKHIKGGFGIVFDDVLAGLMALVCLQGFAWWAA